MTLDDAIAYYDEVAEKCRKKANIERNDYMDLKDNASEAEQLADWLNELKLLRDRIEIQHEPCDDAVSRRKAFEYFVSLWECIGTIMDREEWEDVCKTTANELPSVTPKRKTGQWLDNYQYGYKCSECGAYLEIDCGDVEMNFCPNCSADMRGI